MSKPCARKLVALHHAPRRRHEQRPRKIGGGIGEHAGSVAHRNAARGRRRNIDIVEAHGHLADHLDLRADRIHQVRINLVGQQTLQAGHALDFSQQHVIRGRERLRPHVDVVLGGQALHHFQTLGWNQARDEDARFGHESHY